MSTTFRSAEVLVNEPWPHLRLPAADDGVRCCGVMRRCLVSAFVSHFSVWIRPPSKGLRKPPRGCTMTTESGKNDGCQAGRSRRAKTLLSPSAKYDGMRGLLTLLQGSKPVSFRSLTSVRRMAALVVGGGTGNQRRYLKRCSAVPHWSTTRTIATKTPIGETVEEGTCPVGRWRGAEPLAVGQEDVLIQSQAHATCGHPGCLMAMPTQAGPSGARWAGPTWGQRNRHSKPAGGPPLPGWQLQAGHSWALTCVISRVSESDGQDSGPSGHSLPSLGRMAGLRALRRRRTRSRPMSPMSSTAMPLTMEVGGRVATKITQPTAPTT